MKLIHFLSTIILILATGTTSSGQSAVLEVDRDAFICDCEPDANNPGGPLTKLFQGPYYVGGHQCYVRTASAWNLGSLPQGISISQATVEFKCTAVYGTMTGQMVFYRFLQDWIDTSITINNTPPYSSEDSVATGWPAAGQWLSVDVTDIVRFWYEHPDSNFGLYGHCANTTSTIGAVALNSSRFSTSSERPKLTITYTITDVHSQEPMIPSKLHLEAFPNPFNPSTNIRFEIGNVEDVTLKIYNTLGYEVAMLLHERKSPGQYSVSWNASQFSSGIYLISLTAGGKNLTKKVVLVK